MRLSVKGHRPQKGCFVCRKAVFQDRACPLGESLEATCFFHNLSGVTVDEPLPRHQEWRSNFHGDSSSGIDLGPGSHVVLDRLFSSAVVLPAGVFAVFAVLCPGAVVLRIVVFAGNCSAASGRAWAAHAGAGQSNSTDL